MDAKVVNASLAYTEALKRTAGGGVANGDSVSPGAGGASFADLLKDAAEDVVQATRNSETMAVRAAAKDAELVDVVTAITNAEVALEAVVSVRDKVVQAYQDIIKMPI